MAKLIIVLATTAILALISTAQFRGPPPPGPPPDDMAPVSYAKNLTCGQCILNDFVFCVMIPPNPPQKG